MLLHRRDGCPLPPRTGGGFFHHGQALHRRAAEAGALRGRTERPELRETPILGPNDPPGLRHRVPQGFCRLRSPPRHAAGAACTATLCGGRVSLCLTRGSDLVPGLAHAQVTALLEGSDRGVAGRRGQDGVVPGDCAGDIAGCRMRFGEEFANPVASRPSHRGPAILEVPKPLQLYAAVVLLKGRLRNQGLEDDLQAGRRHHRVPLAWRGRRRLPAAIVVDQPPIGVAVTLIRRPGVSARLVGGDSALGDRIDESLLPQQRFVERRREIARRLVVHRPSRGDDTPDAHVDEGPCHAGCEGDPVVQHGVGGKGAKVAAVDEHQLGDDPHRPDLLRPKEGPVGEDDATSAAVAFRQRSVAGDVDDTPVLGEDGVHDRSRDRLQAILAVGHDLIDTGRDIRDRRRETVEHRLGFPICARQGRIVVGAGRLADDQNGRATVGVLDLLAERFGLEFSQQLRSDRPWRFVAARAVVVVEHLPRDASGVLVQHHLGLAGAGQKRLQFDGYQQFVERASDLRVEALTGRRFLHQVVNETRLRDLTADFGAGPTCVEGVLDLRLLSELPAARHLNEVVVGAAVA